MRVPVKIRCQKTRASTSCKSSSGILSCTKRRVSSKTGSRGNVFAQKLVQRMVQIGAPQLFAMSLAAALTRADSQNNRMACSTILYNFKQRPAQLLQMGAEAVVQASLHDPLQLDTKEKRRQAEILRENAATGPPPPFATKMFRCGRCRSSEHTVHTLAQTRSGDEGSTARVSCLKCGNNFKVC